MDSVFKSIKESVVAKITAMFLVSHEEDRTLDELLGVASELSQELILWSIASGLTEFKGKTRTSLDPDMTDPIAVLSHIEQVQGKFLFVLADFHPFLKGDVVVRRKFREVARSLKTQHKSMIIMSPVLEVPPTLEKVLHVVDIPVPSRQVLRGRLDALITRVQAVGGDKFSVDLTEGEREEVVSAGLGITLHEFDRCLGLSMSREKCLDHRTIELVRHEKSQIVKKSGMMEFLETKIGFDDVGGNDLMKRYIQRRKRAFSKEAREFGLDTPKGVLYVGPPGVGKSLIAKATANALGVSLIRLDMGSLFGGLVGESEANARKAIQVAEAVAPCVLWIDEIEKGMSGMGSSGNSDGGTTARVFSTFLTWMNEKQSSVYLFATANDVTKLPPELLRKGRFDEIFASDFPVADEREQILSIHIRKRGRDPESFDLANVVKATDGFSGAELEAIVMDALYSAFDSGSELCAHDLVVAANDTVPLSKTMKEKIDSLREWAEHRARSASSLHFKGPSGQSACHAVANGDKDGSLMSIFD